MILELQVQRGRCRGSDLGCEDEEVVEVLCRECGHREVGENLLATVETEALDSPPVGLKGDENDDGAYCAVLH